MERMRGTIIQISISPGGLPKFPVPEALCGPLGLAGDGHNHPRFHGGPRKALLIVSAQDLQALSREEYPLSAGGLGENLTIDGIDFRQLRAGQRFRAGDAVIELTTVRIPCSALDIYNDPGRPRIQDRIFDPMVKAGDPASPRWAVSGFYTSVLTGGTIRTGDPFELLEQVV